MNRFVDLDSPVGGTSLSRYLGRRDILVPISETGRALLLMTLAGDRPPRYDKKTVLETSRGTGNRATGTSRSGGLFY